MNIRPTELPGVFVVEPRVYHDSRGHFFEVWHQERFREAGLPSTFIQDNQSHSARRVLRGLHLQHPAAQAKLVRVVAGAIWDVAVDVRHGSPSFGRWVGVTLSDENRLQMFVPAGFAHGFVVTGDSATVSYKCDGPYSPGNELTVLWDDPELGIAWPVTDPVLSEKDRAGLRLRDIPADRLPPFRG